MATIDAEYRQKVEKTVTEIKAGDTLNGQYWVPRDKDVLLYRSVDGTTYREIGTRQVSSWEELKDACENANSTNSEATAIYLSKGIFAPDGETLKLRGIVLLQGAPIRLNGPTFNIQPSTDDGEGNLLIYSQLEAGLLSSLNLLDAVDGGFINVYTRDVESVSTFNVIATDAIFYYERASESITGAVVQDFWDNTVKGSVNLPISSDESVSGVPTTQRGHNVEMTGQIEQLFSAVQEIGGAHTHIGLTTTDPIPQVETRLNLTTIEPSSNPSVISTDDVADTVTLHVADGRYISLSSITITKGQGARTLTISLRSQADGSLLEAPRVIDFAANNNGGTPLPLNLLALTTPVPDVEAYVTIQASGTGMTLVNYESSIVAIGTGTGAITLEDVIANSGLVNLDPYGQLDEPVKFTRGGLSVFRIFGSGHVSILGATIQSLFSFFADLIDVHVSGSAWFGSGAKTDSPVTAYDRNIGGTGTGVELTTNDDTNDFAGIYTDQGDVDVDYGGTAYRYVGANDTYYMFRGNFLGSVYWFVYTSLVGGATVNAVALMRSQASVPNTAPPADLTLFVAPQGSSNQGTTEVISLGTTAPSIKAQTVEGDRFKTTLTPAEILAFGGNTMVSVDATKTLSTYSITPTGDASFQGGTIKQNVNGVTISGNFSAPTTKSYFETIGQLPNSELYPPTQLVFFGKTVNTNNAPELFLITTAGEVKVGNSTWSGDTMYYAVHYNV